MPEFRKLHSDSSFVGHHTHIGKEGTLVSLNYLQFHIFFLQNILRDSQIQKIHC